MRGRSGSPACLEDKRGLLGWLNGDYIGQRSTRNNGRVEQIATSRREAAALVGLSDRELKRAIDNDEIRAKCRARKCLVDVADLKAWFEALPSELPKKRTV